VTTLRQRMLEDLQIRNYAPTTIAAYIRGVAGFAKHFGKPPDQLGPEHIRQYQLFLSQQKRASLSTYIQVVAGLRFFYTHTLHRQVAIERIPLPRYEKKLPIILSQQEVKALLEAPRNLGHRAMLSTMYAAGPRVSELAHLKVHDTAEVVEVTPLLLAVEAAHGLAVSRREAWSAHLRSIHLQDVSEGRTNRRPYQGNPPPLPEARFRHAPVGCGREPPHHSDPARPFQIGDHRALLARLQPSRARHG